MGTIDKKTFSLTCTKCKSTESSSVLDKGSCWNGSHWGSDLSFNLFEIKASGGGNVEPQIQSAVCKKCRIAPRIEIDYST